MPDTFVDLEAEKNKERVEYWFEQVWNQGRAEVIDELFTADGLAHGIGPNGTDLQGPDGFKTAHVLFRGAFPDLKIRLGPIVAGGNYTAVHFVCQATHQGDHLGVPASGKPVTFSGMSITHWRDGKIIEGWNTLDLLSVLQQVGAMEALSKLP